MLGVCAIIAGGPAQSVPMIAGCHVFPEDNIWNQPVDTLPVDKSSALYIQTIGSNSQLHPDSDQGYGMAPPLAFPLLTYPAASPWLM